MFVLSQDEKNSCKELVRLAKIAKRDDANEGDITVVFGKETLPIHLWSILRNAS